MKVENLMIGDWVIITEPDDFHGYVGEVKIINYETGYVTVHIPNMHLHAVFVEDLQPIPLTKELLIKNGFEEFCEGCIIKELSDDEIPTLYIWNGSVKSICVVDNYSTNKYTYVKECEYVHEFQHELKSCGIEKEIVL